MRRILIVAAILIGGAQAASADVRHSGFPKAARGLWATSAEFCGGGNDGSPIRISASRIVTPALRCKVEYVVETAGERGAIFSAHGVCRSRARPPARSILNLVVQPSGDSGAAIGTTLGDMKPYGRCP
jgi:hypothetical protein